MAGSSGGHATALIAGAAIAASPKNVTPCKENVHAGLERFAEAVANLPAIRIAPKNTPLFGEHLGDLHSVCGRALANLVAAAP